MNRQNLVSQYEKLDFIKQYIKDGYVLDREELAHFEEYKQKFSVVTPRKYPLKDLTSLLQDHKKQQGNLIISKDEIKQIKLLIDNNKDALEYYKNIKKEADFWVELTDEELYAMVPDKYPGTYSPGQYEGCPIHGGNYDAYVASVHNPYRWQCKKGGEWWYDGAVVENPETGEKVIVQDNGYGWKAPKGFVGAGKRFYFTAAYRRFMMKQLFWGGEGFRKQPACVLLAYMYQITGELKYAHKAILLLNRLAEIYQDLNGNWHPHRTNGGSHLDDYVFENYYCKNILLSYDLVFEALPKMQKLVEFFNNKYYKEQNYSCYDTIQQNIEQKMIAAMLDFSQNTTLGLQMLMLTRGIVLFAGTVLGHKEILEYCFYGENGIEELFTNGMHIEGKYCEDTFGYMIVSTNLSLEIMCCREYLEKANIPVDTTQAFLHLLLRTQINCSGRSPVFGDTHATQGQIDVLKSGWSYTDEAGFLLCRELQPLLAEKRSLFGDKSTSSLFTDTVDTMNPIYDFKMLANLDSVKNYDKKTNVTVESNVYPDSGFGILRSNESFMRQKHIVLYFAYTNGHRHYDKLGINLFAYGYSLVTDTGYPANNYNASKRFDWDSHAASHSVVVVDEKDQKASYGSLMHYVDMKDVNMIEASQEAAYDIPLYRRAIFSGHGRNGEWYVLDLFRVKGGKLHDYKWSGPRGKNGDVKIITEKPVQWIKQSKGTLAGEEVEFGSRPGYGWLKDVMSANVSGSMEAFFETGDSMGTGLRVMYPSNQAGEFIKAKGEALGLYMQSELDPFIIKRNRFEQDEENSSVFLSLLEPYENNGKIIGFKNIYPQDHEDDKTAYAVKIEMINCNHYYMGELSDKIRRYSIGNHQVEVHAEHLFLEEAEGMLTRGYALSAERLCINGKEFLCRQDTVAKVLKVEIAESRFDIDIITGELSNEDEGRIVLTETGTIKRNGFQIKKVELIDKQQVRVYPKYPNLSCGTIIVKEVLDEKNILTVSEFGKTYYFNDFYDGRQIISSCTGEMNTILKRHRIDSSLYRVEFSSPFKKMPSVGDKLQILAIHEGAYVKIPKLTTLTFG